MLRSMTAKEKLPSSKKNILMIGNHERFFTRELLRGVLSIRAEGCDWNIWCLPSTLKIPELMAVLKFREVHGIIACGLGEQMSKFIHCLEKPSVFVRALESKSADYINGPEIDDIMVSKLVGAEFSDLSLRYWGYLNWEGVKWSEVRKETFQEYADSIGVTCTTLSLEEDSRENWRAIQKIVKWVKEMPKPCGILACNDKAGMEILHACELLRIKVPQEVAVIGSNNDRLICESTTPSLTSVDLKITDMGKEAALKLLEEIDGVRPDVDHTRAEVSVVVRSSSHEVDKYQLSYQMALDFIHEKPLACISVSDVAKACGISRRRLERSFEKCAQTSPAVVIREKRINDIIRLLRDDTSSIENISQQAGFTDAAGLSNFVKRMTGKTPGMFRVSVGE